MSIERKLMGTTDATGGPANYVEDVFSTYLYTGNGASQTINNGIALATGFSLTPGTALAGGYFGGFISTSGTGVATHALIVAPKATGEALRQWKTTNTSTAGTSSVIDGPADSAAMNNASHPAAQFCEGLTIGGYSDWYMPAKNELEVLYYFLKPTTYPNYTSSGSNANAVSPEPISTNYSSGSPAQTSATAFQSGGAEAFAADAYWSSTEYSATAAWYQGFLDGGQLRDVNKSVSIYVRAVRRVAIADAILDPYRVTGKGGLVWLKSRSAATDHALYDTVRGATFDLVSNSTAAQTTQATGLTAFGSTGFSIGALAKINTSAATYASWTFREQAKFFDVVTYTGTGANRTIAHNLGSVPGMIIVKRTDTTSDWQVYHRSNANTQYMVLNTTAAVATGATRWNSTTPTASVFSLGTDASVNASGGTYVAYIYAHDAGGFGASGTDNVISCGSFTSNGSVLPITLGYEPQWLLFKPSSGVGDWELIDNMRGFQVDRSGATVDLKPSTSAAEAAYGIVGPTSTGFTFDNGGTGVTYIYMAIRRGPMKVPTDATKVYNGIARTGTGATATVTGVGFVPDMSMTKRRNGSSTTPALLDRLRSAPRAIYPTSTVAEVNDTTIATSFNMDGITFGTDTGVNGSTFTYINWFFGRAPGFFDEVCYTGTGVARTVNHNLGVAPELMLIKGRSNPDSWWVYNQTLGNTKYLQLQLNGAAGSFNLWNNTSPTSSVFSLSSYNSINTSGSTFVAYLFASCPGVSNVGSYTGTGAAQTINCGFTAGARFVLIKRTDSTGDWYTFDTARGMVSGTDPYLLMNSTAAEVNANNVFTSSTGFTIQAAAPAGINASGGTFIYLAVA